jgi:hypothetical protein
MAMQLIMQLFALVQLMNTSSNKGLFIHINTLKFLPDQ